MLDFEKHALAMARNGQGGIPLDEPLDDTRAESGFKKLDGYTEVVLLSRRRYELLQLLFRDEAARVAAEDAKASFAAALWSEARNGLSKYFPAAPTAAAGEAVFKALVERTEGLQRRTGKDAFLKKFQLQFLKHQMTIPISSLV